MCTPVGVDAGHFCACDGGTTCASGCADLQNDPGNCGRCGNTCPGGQTCTGGLCPCTDAASNTDGHCCLPGWLFSTTFSGNPARCFLWMDAGTHTQALADCRQATLAGYGAPASAVGFGISTSTTGGVMPMGSCGSFWRDPLDERVEITQSQGNAIGNNTCSPQCMGSMGASSCICTACNCSTVQVGCDQPFFCVMDPLGPYVQGPCANSGQCPAGDICANGICVKATMPFCAANADCADAGGAGICNYRGSGQSGLCQ
jgi:hypothetical protein